MAAQEGDADDIDETATELDWSSDRVETEPDMVLVVTSVGALNAGKRHHGATIFGVVGELKHEMWG